MSVVDLPLTGSKLKIDEGFELEDLIQFRMLVGSLQYLTFTRPNLTYQGNHISQFMQRPKSANMIVAKRI